jgi:lipopolysaccharide biosynthesis regulator YciM
MSIMEYLADHNDQLADRVDALEKALRKLMLAHWATKEWDEAVASAEKVLEDKHE